jgi:acid stress chaperone HdeA
MRTKWWAGSALLLVAIATAATLSATLAAEFQKPVTQWTCAEFLSVDDEFKPMVVHRATTYAKGGQPEATAVDIKGIEKVTPQIIGECTKAPQDSFWSRLKDEWKKAGVDKEG